MQKDISAKTGNAEIKKTGHTAGPRFGVDTNKQMIGGKTQTHEVGIKG